jgi:hypothetical protein
MVKNKNKISIVRDKKLHYTHKVSGNYSFFTQKVRGNYSLFLPKVRAFLPKFKPIVRGKNRLCELLSGYLIFI